MTRKKAAAALVPALSGLVCAGQAQARTTVAMPDLHGESAVVAKQGNREQMAGLFGPPSIDAPAEFVVRRHGRSLRGTFVVCAGPGQLRGTLRGTVTRRADGTRSYQVKLRVRGGTQAYHGARGSFDGAGGEPSNSAITTWELSGKVSIAAASGAPAAQASAVPLDQATTPTVDVGRQDNQILSAGAMHLRHVGETPVKMVRVPGDQGSFSGYFVLCTPRGKIYLDDKLVSWKNSDGSTSYLGSWTFSHGTDAYAHASGRGDVVGTRKRHSRVTNWTFWPGGIDD